MTGQVPAPASIIVYDGECIFCANYVRFMRLRRSVGPIEMIDARGTDPRVAGYQERGYDLDEGMLFDRSGKVYRGADAVHALALLCTRSSVFNRLNAVLLSNRRFAAVAYPLLKAGRRLTLLVRGRGSIVRPSRREAAEAERVERIGP